MTKQEFIEAIANAAIKYAPQYGICVVSPIIAQACLESAYGTSPKAKYHNYFGLKYRKDRLTCHSGYFKDGSKEQTKDGTYIPVTADWYAFNNLDSGVQGYFQFTDATIYSNLEGVTDPYEYLKRVHADGFATAHDYVKNVWSVVEKWNLTQYDDKLKGGNAMIKIGLDAGHGLYTSGKQTPNGIKEWTLNDKVRDKVVEILKDYNVEIINVDNDEGKTDESLSYRLNKYLNAKVDAFVSIHHNAYTGNWNNATGVEVYTDNHPTSEDKRLAQCIYSNLAAYTGLRGRGIKQCDFYVINQDRIPAVLVEGGFMDGTTDYKVITSEAGQAAYAKAVAQGLITFFDLTRKETVSDVTTKPVGSNSITDSEILYKVQVGAFGIKKNAQTVVDALRKKGYSAIIIEANKLYKVQVGAFKSPVNANNLLIKLRVDGYYGIIIRQ